MAPFDPCTKANELSQRHSENVESESPSQIITNLVISTLDQILLFTYFHFEVFIIIGIYYNL